MGRGRIFLLTFPATPLVHEYLEDMTGRYGVRGQAKRIC